MLRPAPPPPWLDSNAVVRRISLGQLVVVVIEPGGRRPPHAAQSNRVSCLRRARFGPVMLLLSVGSDSPNDGSWNIKTYRILKCLVPESHHQTKLCIRPGGVRGRRKTQVQDYGVKFSRVRVQLRFFLKNIVYFSQFSKINIYSKDCQNYITDVI
jgi:hypothetical protein